jgi:hypothetical protein
LDAISSKALDTTDAEEITIKGRKRSKSTIKKAKRVRQATKPASSSEEDRDSFSDNETESSDDNIDSIRNSIFIDQGSKKL